MDPNQNLQPSEPTPQVSQSVPNTAPGPQTLGAGPAQPTHPQNPTTPLPQSPPVPPPTPGAVIYGAGSAPIVSTVSRKPRKKKFLLIGLLILVLLLVAGYVFGYYLPNKPDNAYKTGINRTGYALDKMINGATEKSSLDALKKSDITLGIEAKYNEATYAGSFNAKFDASKANAGIDFTSTGKDTHQIFNAKIMGELPAGSQYPNVYVQLNGLKDLDIDTFVPGTSSYDGKWIAVMSDYLKSLGNVPTAEETSKKQLTSDDFAELAKAATSVTREYVFSTDPDKAVFEKQTFVGKEKIDGVSAFHYKVTLNQDHLSAYCKAAVDKIYTTNAYKKLPWVNEKNVDKDKEEAKNDCKPSEDENTYDLWIESKYKLIYKYRVTDSKQKDTYLEFGQLYKGGNTFTFFVNYHSAEGNMDSKSSLEIDFKANSTKGTVSFSGGEAESKYSVKITLDAKPYNGEITVNKPAETIPVADVLKTFGIDAHSLFGAYNSESATASGDNTERQTDIKAIHGQVEAYYAQNGYYPSLNDINNTAWRAANLKGLDKEALKDPDGTTYLLAAKPATNVYSYDVKAADGGSCNNPVKQCTQYTLTATYPNANGATFVKSNLN